MYLIYDASEIQLLNIGIPVILIKTFLQCVFSGH